MLTIKIWAQGNDKLMNNFYPYKPFSKQFYSHPWKKEIKSLENFLLISLTGSWEIWTGWCDHKSVILSLGYSKFRNVDIIKNESNSLEKKLSIFMLTSNVLERAALPQYNNDLSLLKPLSLSFYMAFVLQPSKPSIKLLI